MGIAEDIDAESVGAVVPAPLGYLPPYVRAVIEAAARAGLAALSRARAPHDPKTPLVVAVMRDEAARVPGFLAHYRRLGVTRFAVVDHGSVDATRRLLAAEPDVELYAAAGPFAGKQAWVNALIARTGYDRWYLHVDADERLVFDGAAAEGPVGSRAGSRAGSRVGSRGRRLAELVAFAEAQGLVRLRGMLVDLYPAGPLAAAGDAARDLFDAEGYAETLCLERVSRKGGPRRRAFGIDPELTKYPLFFIRAGEVVASPHHLHPYRENYRSDCFLALLHDKFGPGFLGRARRAVAEGNYWRGSLEYRATLAALDHEPRLALAFPGSRRYRMPSDLVAAGLIAPIPWAGRPGLPGRIAGWSRRRAVAQA